MGVDKGKGLSENVSSSGDFFFRAGPSLTRDSAMTPSSSHVPFLSTRYPLRMPLRYGCALFGCSLPVPTSEKRYCCESHEIMATQMDAMSGACIFFDGLKTVDVSLCTALLHRTRGGTGVGVPTSPEVSSLFSHGSSALNSTCSLSLAKHVGAGRSSVKTLPKRYTLQWGDWGLLRYSHMGVYLFCLTLNASRSTLTRTAAAKEGSGLQVMFDSFVSSLLNIGKRKRKERIALMSGKRWGSLKITEGSKNSAESKSGVEMFKEIRDYIVKLGSEALTEDLEIEVRYKIQALSADAVAWFDQNEAADLDDWRAKANEFETALHELKRA
ncbi:predicted protein [Arabidopsis lyrata subsp. lyrata]|uniref:Predicted protein n=1 Tax=Arabidopsis lyrata subsp. lyrata TaxID=81972 RepID=D7MEJ6_ARALL|nr:predicted protein [Arabidopsis lyrata subsp. lyrata]